MTVSPARCDEAGVLDGGRTVISGDGSVVRDDGDSQLVNDGQGAAVYSEGAVSIVNNGDGSGTYSDGRVSIVVGGDGSGTYTDGRLSVDVDGQGAGTSTDGTTSIVLDGDGSGTYTDATVSIVNNGDGSATYSNLGTGLTIVNDGQGTALVSSGQQGWTVQADPVPPAASAGRFPSIDAARPVESCGTLISLSDSVLFDFGSHQLRGDAQEVLTSLAEVLNEAGVTSAQLGGHTDSISDEAFNQTLSEQRAQAVAESLRSAGVRAELEVAGYGESRPVAPNENPDGSDNPAGRSLNRRVEVFVPAL
ncbi:MAG: OmpA family protein [Actinomyces urogenitalis]|uniref:OmpA family protein n=1 Tax=Actinomyces urogenitalis TaxID=103621 RepID=UPI002A81C489|nr:OmpA family protein [Actinomyces urogenitalis]MDY3678341.1 OmpA family protein [Actinomyces urogenitalis]